MDIIEEVIEEAIKRIQSEIKEIDAFEEEFLKPFPPRDDPGVYAQYVTDRCPGGQYTGEALQEKLERKADLQRQLGELAKLPVMLQK